MGASDGGRRDRVGSKNRLFSRGCEYVDHSPWLYRARTNTARTRVSYDSEGCSDTDCRGYQKDMVWEAHFFVDQYVGFYIETNGFKVVEQPFAADFVRGSE